MKINGTNFIFVDTFNSPIFVPDCFVKRGSKIGGGNGEALAYCAGLGHGSDERAIPKLYPLRSCEEADQAFIKTIENY